MTTKIRSRLAVSSAFLLAVALSWVQGCASSDQPGDLADTPTSSAASAGGALLWAESCARCHNLRSPSSYSSTQWEVIVDHMRVRCYLSGEDARTIVAFLKAGAGSDESTK